MARFFKPQQGSKRKASNLSVRELQLQITDLDSEARGVGRHQNKVVFVEGALPGEQVTARVTQEQKRFLTAKALKIENPSEHRIAPVCPHYGVCGGCQLQHLDYPAQVAAKQAALKRTLEQIGNLCIDKWDTPLVGECFGYRRRSRISLKYSPKQGLQMGFRAASSDRIQPIRTCPVMTPALEHALTLAREVLPTLKGLRHLGHLELIDANEGAIMLLRCTGKLSDADLQALSTLQQQHVQVRIERNNGEIIDLDGNLASDLHYQLQASPLGFAAGDFIQVNAALNQAMVARALAWLAPTEQDRVLDLFCGVGNFSLPLARQAREVVGVEGVPVMVERATRNAKSWQLNNIEFVHLDLDKKKGLMAFGEFDKVLLDPARAGAAEIAAQLPAIGADALLYVSCNPATLARDAAEICRQGYKIDKACLIDMFPQTRHQEAMLLFTKA